MKTNDDLKAQVLSLLSGRRKHQLADSRGEAAEDASKLKLSERELVERAMLATGLTFEEYLKRALLAYARRDVVQAETSKALENRDRRAGLLGSANARIQAAYDQLVAAGMPITPARLRHRSKAGFATCRLWLERHSQGGTKP